MVKLLEGASAIPSTILLGKPGTSHQLLRSCSERKRLIYRIEERATAVAAILQAHVQADPETKAILFHESIDEVMQLFSILRSAGLPVVAEHSELPDAMRAESLRLFRTGAARVIVSARSLIEGFNVPSADIGIVVAASSSVRQRVQTLGRLLRKSQKADGGEKQATLYVLYAARTVDELVYEKARLGAFDRRSPQRVLSLDGCPHHSPQTASRTAEEATCE